MVGAENGIAVTWIDADATAWRSSVNNVEAWAAPALHGLAVGDELIVIAWFHQADRDVLQVHPRGETRNPLTGVFATRSPDRPNPLGLHTVTVRSIDGTRLRIGPIETIDGTPIVDIKPVL